MTTITDAGPRFAPGFTREAVETLSLAKGEPEWMREKRLAAFAAYEATPLPTRDQRAWKYTDVSRLDLDAFAPHARPPADIASRAMLRVPDEAGAAGVLQQFDSHAHGGELFEEAQRQGVVFTSLDRAVKEHPDLLQRYFMTECVPAGRDKFTALHGAFWSGGVFVYVPKNVEVRLPLYNLLWAESEAIAVFPHALIVAEPNSQVTLVEEYGSAESQQGILSCGVTEIIAHEGARVRYVNLQCWGSTATHFGMQRALLDRAAGLNFATIGLGGRLAKATGESVMRGEGASSELLGLFFGRRGQQFDYVTLQDHQAPHTTSDLLFKSALTDRARSIYYGLVRVGPQAAASEANQENRNLLLSDRAKADSDPVLEILTSEVTRCTHGASVGPVDEEELFYLQSRGIQRTEAEKLLVSGFFNQVIGRVPDESVQQRLHDTVDERVLLLA